MAINRVPEFPVNKLFIERRSLRALSGEAITHEELMSLFEAAKWAPSSFDAQPWRFLYAHRDTPLWEMFFNLLNPSNQEWAVKAGVLMVIISRTKFKVFDSVNPSHALDAGAAWQNMALQGWMNGIIVHGIGGFDYVRARSALAIPAHFEILAMAAVGRPGNDAAHLNAKRQAQEETPTQRNPVSSFIAVGPFVESID